MFRVLFNVSTRFPKEFHNLSNKPKQRCPSQPHKTRSRRATPSHEGNNQSPPDGGCLTLATCPPGGGELGGLRLLKPEASSGLEPNAKVMAVWGERG